MIRRCLEAIAVLSSRHYRTVLGVTAVLVVLSLFAVTRLRFDTDILNLLPPKDPVVQQFVSATKRFGGVDYLLVAIRVPEGSIPEPYEMLTDRLGERLEKLPELKKVDYRIGDPTEILETVFPKAVLFLDAEGLDRLAARLSKEGLEERVGAVSRLLQSPQGVALKQLVKLDPFGLAEIFLGRIEAARGNLAVDWTSGYYLSRDHRMLLILASPVKPPQDTDFDVQLVAAVEREVAAVRAEWPEIAGAEAPEPVIELGGTYLTALDDYRQIRRDIVLNVLSSTTFVLLLFLLAFRRLGPLLYAIVPIACGLLFTFAFTALVFGSVASTTSGTAALLIGLAVDFVIVTYGRYVEERRRGVPLEPALVITAVSAGRGVFFGAVTTVATFFAFLVTEFKGLRQMGLLTGTGILFCLIAVAFLVPALIAWGEARHRRRATMPNLYLHSFGTTGLMRLSMGHPRAALAIGLSLTALFVYPATQLEFEEGMASLRAAGANRGIELGKEIAQRFSSGFDSMMLVARGTDLDAVYAATERAVAGAQELKERGTILGFSALTSVVPSPLRQEQAVRWLEAGRRGGLLDPARVEADFRAALAVEGMRAEPFARGLELFHQAIAPTRPTTPQEFAGEEAATHQILDRYLQRTDDGWISVVYLYPPQNLWRREPPPDAMAMAASLGPDLYLTGPNVLNAHMRGRIKQDAVVSAVLGMVLVVVLLWIDFRRLSDVLLALFPLLVGIVWMLGGMGLLGIKLNFMNVFVTTMIIGIGVDYGIHAVHRHRELAGRPEKERHDGTIETGKAILVAALSTVVGFGSLATSGFPGLRTTGYVATLGALSTALIAITILPALFALREKRDEIAERNDAP
jgi:predicted RND superfamily exporter protein